MMIYETTHLSPCEEDGSHKCRITKDTLAAYHATAAAPTTPPAPSVERVQLYPTRDLAEEDGMAVFLMKNGLYFSDLFHNCAGSGDSPTGLYVLQDEGDWRGVKPNEVEGFFKEPTALPVTSSSS